MPLLESLDGSTITSDERARALAVYPRRRSHLARVRLCGACGGIRWGGMLTGQGSKRRRRDSAGPPLPLS